VGRRHRGLLGYATFLGLCVLGVRAPEHLLRVPLFWIVAVSLRSTVQLVAFVRAHGPVAFDGRGLGSWLRRTLALDAGSIARGLMTSVDVLVLGVLVAPE
jgi:hypothetical protein